jgi:lipid-binding SYLF domain-containing protein
MRLLTKLAVLVVLLVGLGACSRTWDARTEAGSLVDASRWAVERLKNQDDDMARLFRENLPSARGIAIFPAVTKGAFILGAQGGSGVVLARGDDGTWSYPAFYNLAAGSFGLQAGFQSAEVVLLLRSQRAVQAVIRNQGKFGGDLQFAIGEIGGGISAATTTALGADIIGFSNVSGLFAGMSLDGAGIIRRNDLNQAFYGRSVSPEAIVLRREVTNPQADLLRQTLAGGR